MADQFGDTTAQGTTAGGWRRWAGWSLVGLLLLFEYGLFRQYAEREVVWGYPGGFDQTHYLVNSYATFEHILEQGPRHGLAYGLGLPIPNGMMLHVQASVLYLLLGASRLSALTLNFLYFALLQVVLVGTARWYGGRWSVSLFALGLLLAATTPFYPAGGLMDFRIDFIAGCLFGVFVCLAVRSRLFASWGWSAAAGGAAAGLVAFRYLTAVYLAGILGPFFLLLCAALYLRRRDAAARRALLCRLRGLATVGLLILLLAGPLVWHNRGAIKRYYVGHITSWEAKERYREFGVNDLTDRLLYYPRSILRDHTGPTFLALGGLALVTALAAGRFRPAAAPPPGSAGWGTAGFAAACVAVPVLTLTVYSSPSPVVGGLVVPALVWLAVAVALRLARLGPGSPPGRARAAWAAALAGVTLAAGFSAHAGALSRRGPQSRMREDADQVVQLADELARHSRVCGCAAPVVACNELCDYLYASAAQALIYERHHVLLPVQPSLGVGLGPVSEADALAAVGRSDFVILNAGRLPEFAGVPAPAYSYPFTKSMAEIRPQMRAACEREFVPLRRFAILGDEVILFGRPAVRPAGATTDGWVTSGGLTVTARGADLRRFPRLELRGEDAFALLGRAPAVRAELLVPGQTSRAVPAKLVTSGAAYALVAEVDPADVPDEPSVVIRLTFDASFCPQETIPGNGDPRRLVMRAPSRTRLLPREP